jgi:aspartate racemase
MEEEFYKVRLLSGYEIETIIPDATEREIVHRIIYNELCLGKISELSKTEYIRIIENLVRKGAEGIVLGCTEIPLLVRQEDVSVPVFNTMKIHAESAVMKAVK